MSNNATDFVISIFFCELAAGDLLPVSQGETDCRSEWGRMPHSSSRGRGSGLLGCGDPGYAKAGMGINIYGFVCSCGCVVGAFVRVVLGSTATRPMSVADAAAARAPCDAACRRSAPHALLDLLYMYGDHSPYKFLKIAHWV